MVGGEGKLDGEAAVHENRGAGWWWYVRSRLVMRGCCV